MTTGIFTFLLFLKQFNNSKKHVLPLLDKFVEFYYRYNNLDNISEENESKNEIYNPKPKICTDIKTKTKTDGKISILIPVFNEDPDMVRDTAISALSALKGRGDVFILDDSTDPVKKEGINILAEIGVKIIRRKERKGYKAGAINHWLRIFGDLYQFLAIFDADQRPKSNFFDETLKYFEDSDIAFVQVPQHYTETSTGFGIASFWQQQPFLRIVMRGRLDSAFSLGSGTVYRIDALKEIEGLDEDTTTEDVATSLVLHSRGWKSVYTDRNLIWYGEPPKDLNSYLQQQGRWSLGGFQVLPKLLKSDLNRPQFLDYTSSWMYWLKEGPITLFEIFAPIIFILFNTPFIKINALLYTVVYIPFFISSLTIIFLAGRKYYGLKGFLLHQAVEMLAFISISYSFILWVLRRKIPFKRTPKKKISPKSKKQTLFYSSPYWILTLLLFSAVVKGTYIIIISRVEMWLTVLVNVIWAVYFIPFLLYGLYIIYKDYEEQKTGKLIQRV